MLTVYNASEFILLFGEINLAPGRNKEEFFRIERIGEDISSVEIDLDGNECLSANKDNRHFGYLTLRQESPVNALLSAIAKLTQESPGMIGAIKTFSAKDPNGLDTVFAANASIARDPDAAWGEKPGTREWKFNLLSTAKVIGGSLPVEI